MSLLKKLPLRLYFYKKKTNNNSFLGSKVPPGGLAVFKIQFRRKMETGSSRCISSDVKCCHSEGNLWKWRRFACKGQMLLTDAVSRVHVWGILACESMYWQFIWRERRAARDWTENAILWSSRRQIWKRKRKKWNLRRCHSRLWSIFDIKRLNRDRALLRWSN